jgi:hypothetical protein
MGVIIWREEEEGCYIMTKGGAHSFAGVVLVKCGDVTYVMFE